MKTIKLRMWNGVMHPTWYEIRPEKVNKNMVLMQFTGLLDRLGKEIYEGDIIRILYTDWASKSENDKRTIEQYLIEDKCHIGVVIFNTPKFELDFGDERFDSIIPGTHGWLEIIGNIYENKEIISLQKEK